MPRTSLKWTLLGCVVLYSLCTILNLTDEGIASRIVRIGLWVAILGIAAWLIFTRNRSSAN